MLKVAVIGLGAIGNRHAQIYQQEENAQLIGVCDCDKNRADKSAAQQGVPVYYDVQKMLDELKPDICSIATAGYENGSDHFKPTMQALEAGCHVLGEKPICNEIDKARQMVDKAKEKGLCYGIDMNHRFTPAARIAKKWQEQGKLGDLLFVNMAMWIKNPNESSPYFHIKSLHPHTVDIMRHFCGDIQAVHCFATKAPGRKIWSTAQFNMKFKNGAVGSLTGSYDIQRGHPMERCEVAGTNGRFVIDDMWREATLYPAGDEPEDMVKQVYTNPVFGGYKGFEDTFKARIHKFVEQVNRGDKPEDIDGSGADGLAAQKILQAAIESLENQSVVCV